MLAGRRGHSTIQPDAGTSGGDASKVAEEVLAQLVGLVGADVSVTLDVTASVPDGVPDSVLRMTAENCHTLKFDGQGFKVEWPAAGPPREDPRLGFGSRGG